MLNQITPVILTYNEAPNIRRTLAQLNWAQRIIVVDSYSQDETLTILADFPQVEVFKRTFDTHAQQWNFGLQQVKTDWALSLDADYCLSDELIAEIKTLQPEASIDGYAISFKYCVNGQALRGTILPPRVALFRPNKAHYINDGHTQLLSVRGVTGQLKAAIYHDDRKSLNRWLWAQDRYAILEAQKLLIGSPKNMGLADRIRQYKVIAPFATLFYCLILKGGLWDGPAGWYYAWQRMLAEILLSIRLTELEFTASPTDGSSQTV